MYCIPAAITRSNIYKITQDHVRYDLRKFFFSSRVRTLRNSLSDVVVIAESVNSQGRRQVFRARGSRASGRRPRTWPGHESGHRPRAG